MLPGVSELHPPGPGCQEHPRGREQHLQSGGFWAGQAHQGGARRAWGIAGHLCSELGMPVGPLRGQELRAAALGGGTQEAAYRAFQSWMGGGGGARPRHLASPGATGAKVSAEWEKQGPSLHLLILSFVLLPSFCGSGSSVVHELRVNTSQRSPPELWGRWRTHGSESCVGLVVPRPTAPVPCTCRERIPLLLCPFLIETFPSSLGDQHGAGPLRRQLTATASLSSSSSGGQPAFLGTSELVNLNPSAGSAAVATVLLGHAAHVWALLS